jgi:small-conductance mechanosensitive channel
MTPVAATALLAQTPPDIELDEVVGSGLTTTDYLFAGGVILGSVVLAMVAGGLVYRRMSASDDGDLALARTVRRLTRTCIVLIGLFSSLRILDVRATALLGAVGIVVFALAFAAQPILENAFASLALRRRKQFSAGDQVTIDETSGTVVDVNLRNVVLQSFDGERVTVPCGTAVKSVVVNHTILGRRRTEFVVGVHYRTDLPRAREVLLEAVGAVPDTDDDPTPEVWVTGFADSSIEFVVRYWTVPDIATHYRVRSEAMMAVKAAFDASDIEIPFPQRVITRAEGDDSPREPRRQT